MRRARLAGELVARGMVSCWFEQAVGLVFPVRSHLFVVSRGGAGRIGAARGAGGGVVVVSRGLREREVFLHIAHVSVGNEDGFAKGALALPVLALKQVAFALFPAKDFPGPGYLEAFGDSLSGLCFA